MRILSCLVVFAAVSAPIAARADGFLDVVGGIQFPVDDKTWTDTVETSPKLGVRAGAIEGALGGMLSLDWTPENLDNMGGSFGIGNASVAAHRFRVLAHLLFQQRFAGKITAEGRAGVGIDIAHASYSVDILGTHSDHADTNVGFAFELGAGLFFDLGSVQIGPELALPIGTHSHKSSGNGDIAFDYTSYDIDMLLAVRFHAR